MSRKILTHKQGMEALNKVQKEVDSGRMKIKAACAKYKFPVYKYTYWRKMKEESDALDSMIDEHEKDGDKEVLSDSSSLSIRLRLETIKKQQARITELEELIAKFKEENVTLMQQNARLRDKIIGMVLD